MAKLKAYSFWSDIPSGDEMSSCPSLPSILKAWWLLSMIPGQQGHSWVLTWLSCSLLNTWLTGFTSLWLSFSMLTMKLESGVGIKQRSQRKQNLPGWYRVGSGNCEEADKEAISSWPHWHLPCCFPGHRSKESTDQELATGQIPSSGQALCIQLCVEPANCSRL